MPMATYDYSSNRQRRVVEEHPAFPHYTACHVYCLWPVCLLVDGRLHGPSHGCARPLLERRVRMSGLQSRRGPQYSWQVQEMRLQCGGTTSAASDAAAAAPARDQSTETTTATNHVSTTAARLDR